MFLRSFICTLLCHLWLARPSPLTSAGISLSESQLDFSTSTSRAHWQNSSLTTPGPAKPRFCYERRAVYEPVSSLRCRYLLTDMRLTPQAAAPRQWDHRSEDYRWVHTACMVVLKPVGHQDDVFALNLIITVAETILARCIAHGRQRSPWSLGGRAPIAQKWFEVEVTGVDLHTSIDTTNLLSR